MSSPLSLFPPGWIWDYRDLWARLEDGADPTARDSEERTALHMACLYGVEECVEILLGTRCELDARDKYGRTALFYAVDVGKTKLVDLLLEVGASPNVVDQDLWTPSICAAAGDHPAALRALFNHGADRGCRDKHGKTALFWAAQYGYRETLKLLIFPSLINVADFKGMTPLMAAARLSEFSDAHRECYELLLDANADSTVVDSQGLAADDWKRLLNAQGEDTLPFHDLEWDRNVGSSDRGVSDAGASQQSPAAPPDGPQLGRSFSGSRRNAATGLEECAICCESMGRDAKSIGTGLCGHIFCHDCLVAWVRENGRCPTCRTSLDSDQVIKLYV